MKSSCSSNQAAGLRKAGASADAAAFRHWYKFTLDDDLIFSGSELRVGTRVPRLGLIISECCFEVSVFRRVWMTKPQLLFFPPPAPVNLSLKNLSSLSLHHLSSTCLAFPLHLFIPFSSEATCSLPAPLFFVTHRSPCCTHALSSTHLLLPSLQVS